MAVMGLTTAGHVDRLAANLLKVAHARAGMSQRELADAAHVAQSTIARIESGTRQPSLPVLARILAAIDLELRITLEACDNHDDVLDAEDKGLSADQRAAVTRHDAFDPKRIIEMLNRYRVDYVLVGGYAAQLYGARRPTYDIDIAPSPVLDNLHRLSPATEPAQLGASATGAKTITWRSPLRLEVGVVCRPDVDEFWHVPRNLICCGSWGEMVRRWCRRLRCEPADRRAGLSARWISSLAHQHRQPTIRPAHPSAAALKNGNPVVVIQRDCQQLRLVGLRCECR
jgi:transcriptional regulator with XRE-family HTH domain